MSLKRIYKRYRLKISLTLLLVFIDALLMLLFPLVIGTAIQSVIDANYSGLIYLAALSITVLITGSGRRFYDTRVYSKIYEDLATEVSQTDNGRETSEKVAHVNLLNELVEFLENALPMLVANLVGLFGTLVILFTINTSVFLSCLLAMLAVVIVYWLSSGKTLAFNEGYNSEFEKQVSILNKNKATESREHFKRMMAWNIKLSDLETINFGIIWMAMGGLLLFSIYLVAHDDGVIFGTISAVVMYVFSFIESSLSLPFYYQQLLRLKDISTRIENALNQK
jgi:ABC-type multidrug transport system fused ATPase/permease subunit